MTKENNLKVINKQDDENMILEDKNTHFFRKPFEFEGQKYEKIKMDLDGLTGEAIERAETSFTIDSPQQSAQTPLKELSKPFLAYLVAESADVPIEFVRSLPAAEYAKVTTRVQTFLLSGE